MFAVKSSYYNVHHNNVIKQSFWHNKNSNSVDIYGGISGGFKWECHELWPPAAVPSVEHPHTIVVGDTALLRSITKAQINC